MAIITVALIAGAGYLVHMAMETDLPERVREQLAPSETQEQKSAGDQAGYGSQASTKQNSRPLEPARPIPDVTPESLRVPAMGEWVRPGRLNGWDSFNGLAWGTRSSQIDGLKAVGDMGTIFEAEITWYTRSGEITEFAGAKVDSIYYAFINGRLCDVMLNSNQPQTVLRWIEERFGPSNAESHRGGIRRWQGQTSAGYPVVIEYAEKPGVMPSTMRMTLEGIR